MAHDTYTARQCVEHDAVNVLALGARVLAFTVTVTIALPGAFTVQE